MLKHVGALALRGTLVAVFLASLSLMSMASSAGALRGFAIEGERAVTASGKLTFGETELTNTIVCEVTFLKVLEIVIGKAVGEEFGQITGVAINVPGCRTSGLIGRLDDFIVLHDSTASLAESSDCREAGEGVKLCRTVGRNETLWRLRYESFLGTLPVITGIRSWIEEAQFKLRFTLLSVRHTCLYKGDIVTLVTVANRALTTKSIVLEASRLTLARRLEGITCPDPGTVGGTFTIRPGVIVRLV